MPTWAEVQEYARSKYKLAEDKENSFKLVFEYQNKRLQAVYWRLGESEGTLVAVDVVGSLDGTYVGGPELGRPGAITGDPNTAMRLDGVNDEVVIGDVFAFEGVAPFSVEAWVRPNDVRSRGCLVCKLAFSDPETIGWLFSLKDSGTGTAVTFRRRDLQLETTADLAPATAFHHLVAVFDGTTMFIYVDGVVAAERVGSPAIRAHSEPLLFGKGMSWGRGQAELDEVAIYDRALLPTEITRHYELGTSP